MAHHLSTDVSNVGIPLGYEFRIGDYIGYD